MKAKTVIATWCLLTGLLFAFAWVGCSSASDPAGGDSDGATAGGDGGGPGEDGGGGGGGDGDEADGGGGAYCVEDRDCTDATLKVCKTDTNECVECLADGDCTGGTCTDNSCVAQGCTQNSECELGNVCLESACVPGCEDAAQCPPASDAALVKCKPDLGANGKCVECVQKADCPGAFADCDINTWACVKNGCSIDTDCTDAAAPYCDTTDGQCYQCVSDGQCDAAYQCTAHACVLRPTGDCTIDDPPCARQQDGCDPQTKTCYPKCQSYSGVTICMQGVCDTATNLCFDCISNADCAKEGKVCDTATHQCTDCGTIACDSPLKCSSGACVQCTAKADCTDPALPVCNGDGRCVACEQDSDCTAPAKCDPKYAKCTDVVGVDACKACAQDSECGSGKFCIHRTQGAKVLEHVCAWSCGTDAECDKGFSCQEVGTPAHKACYPSYGGGTMTPTCAGMASIGHIGCNDQSDPCTTTGADPADAQCFAYQQYSICTAPCDDDSDCPGANVCRKLGTFSLCSPF